MLIASRAVAVAVFLTACGRSGTPHVHAPVLEPVAAVERFLQAARSYDLETMALLFGTRDGSVLGRDPRSDVEERMFALASLLRHDEFSIAAEQPVPGRLGEALEVVIDMRFGAEDVRVPFTMVRARQGAWMVERIDIEAITARR